MVNFLALTALVLSSTVAAPVATPITVEWQADYGKALAATRADDRPLLIVLDAPKTAAGEKQLDTAGEQAKLLAAYQLCRVDVSTEYGKRVAKVFKADKFPFTAIIDKTGSVVLTKKQGTLTDTEWVKTLSTYKLGVRAVQIHATAYRGPMVESNSFDPYSYPTSGTTIVNPSYCPSCQRNAQNF